MGSMNILDIGCGPTTRGSVGIDIHPHPGVDIVEDITAKPLPFDPDQFDGALMYHVIEHLPRESYEFVLGEIWRTLRPGGVLTIKTPHFSCGRDFWQDPTHVRPFALTTFSEYFKGHEASGQIYGYGFRFDPVRLRLHYNTFPEAGTPRLPFLVRVVEFLANGSKSRAATGVSIAQKLCERRWCYLVGGFSEIHAELVAVKPGA